MAGPGQWRYIAQRFDGTNGGLGQFLDFDVPLQGVELEDVTSGHNGLSATITPEYPRLKGPDGQPILVELGTAIWAEDPDGHIRGGGLLTHSDFNGEGQWAIECSDLTWVSTDTPYTEANFFVNVDALDIFRHIWQHIQSNWGSNLGISIDGTLSGMLLGGNLIQKVDFDLETDVSAGIGDPGYDGDDLGDPQPVSAAPNRFVNNADWRKAAVKAMVAVSWQEDKVDRALGKWLNKDAAVANGTWEELSDQEKNIRKKSIEKVGMPPNPPGSEKPRADPGVFGEDTPPADAPTDTTGEPDAATPVEWVYDEYKLNWYTNHDLSSDIDDLAALAPFDWHMIHYWHEDEIRHHIRIGYPHLGRRRDDLRFVVGENIHQAPTIDRDGTQYANEVIFLGAGEGASQIMVRVFRAHEGRVRRVAVVSDPSVTSHLLASQRAEQELAKRMQIENIAEVELRDHPHAPMGSVDLGDVIHIEGDIGWVDLDHWVKVIGRTLSPDDGDSMRLTVIRVDRLA